MTDLQKELRSIRAKIKSIYTKASDDEIDSDGWFTKNVWPLCQREKEIESEIYKNKLLNVKVGTGVTISCWTDRYAYTIIKRTAKTITIQRDRCVRVDNNGMSECQEYKYYRDKNGDTKVFRWSDKKGWISGCYKLGLGRYEYYDFSF